METDVEQEQDTGMFDQLLAGLSGLKFKGWADRKIRAEIDEHFGVRTSSTKRIYPRTKDGEVVSFKLRDLRQKDFVVHQKEKPTDLFGQAQALKSDKRTLFITEGEEDALALYQCLMDKNRGTQYATEFAVVSLINGASSVKRDLNNNLKFLDMFKKVICVFDNDKAGEEALKAARNVLPSVGHVDMPLKDPCDMLREGFGGQLANDCLFNPKFDRPSELMTVSDLYDEAMKEPERGLSWPWPTLTKLTYGIRKRELHGFGAGTGCGKTEGFKELAQHLMYVHKKKVGLIFLEEPNAKTLKVLAGKRKNKKFHLPKDDGDWTTEELKDALEELRRDDLVVMYGHNAGKDWPSVKKAIRWMANNDIEHVMLDHLTALIAEEPDETKALNRIMKEMADMVHELGITIYYISHLSTPSGKPHEEGGHVSLSQFRGSRAIGYWTNYAFGYERNQLAEDEDERHTTTVRVLKDREYGLATGATFRLRFDHNTGRWLEVGE
jgi:twinkle protein